MTCKISYLCRCICIMLALLMTIELAGCCGYKKNKRVKNNDFLTESLKKQKNKTSNKDSLIISEFGDVHIDLDGEIPLRPQDEQSKDLYEKLDYANQLYKSRNYESALREIDRILQSINNDPYLEMQVWTLSGVVSDKANKPARKKRSYAKMMKAWEKVLKDPRYKNAYKDGMICQELIESASKTGDKKYDFE